MPIADASVPSARGEGEAPPKKAFEYLAAFNGRSSPVTLTIHLAIHRTEKELI